MELKIYKNQNQRNKQEEYNDATKDSDVHGAQTNSFTKTANTWLTVYEHTNYEGFSSVFDDSVTEIDQLSEVTYNVFKPDMSSYYHDTNSKDWKDSVKSVVFTDFAPINPGNVMNEFFRLYADQNSLRAKEDGNHYSFTFNSQGHRYKIYLPYIVLESSTAKNVQVKLKLERTNKAGFNDTAEVLFWLDQDGNFIKDSTGEGSISIQYSYHPNELPDWVISLVDNAIDVSKVAVKFIADAIADIVVDVLSGGTATEADPEMDKIINKTIDIIANVVTFVMDHINYLVDEINKVKGKNGSRLYFPYVVGHAINRAAYAYLKCIQPQFQAGYQLELDSENLPNYKNFMVSKWLDDGTCNFYLDNVFASRYTFMKPDFSQNYNQTGAICSFMVKGRNDNYIAVMMALDGYGQLLSLQGNVYIEEYAGNDDYVAPKSGVITYAYQDVSKPDSIDGQTTTIKSPYRILRSNSNPDTTPELSGEITLLQSYSFHMEKAIRESVRGMNGVLDENLENLPSASVQLIEAILANISKIYVGTNPPEPFVPPTPPSVEPNEVRFYKDSLYRGHSISFYNSGEAPNIHGINWPGTSNNISTDISSLVVGSNVVLTVYSENDCDDNTGEHKTFDSDSAEYNLKKVDQENSNGNWDNLIKSIKMTFNNVPSEEPLLYDGIPQVGPNEVRFYKDSSYSGESISFSSPCEEDDIHDINWPNTRNNISTDISSFVTGSNVTLTFYDENGCNNHEEHKTYGPNSFESDLSEVMKNDNNHNWDDEIKSFKIESIA